MNSPKLETSKVIREIRKALDKNTPVSDLAKKYETRPRTIERRYDASFAPESVLEMLDENQIGITDVETIGRMIRLGGDPEEATNQVLSRPTRRGNSTGDPLELPPEQRKVLSRAAARRLIEDPDYAKKHKIIVPKQVAEFIHQIFG